MRFLGIVFFAVVSVVALVLPACSSKAADNVCQKYTPPSGFDATTPVVHFAVDVHPLLVRSCKFSSCHGSEGAGNQAGLYLGDDATKLVTNVVGVQSSNYAMSRVTAGDPTHSYLMHKIDGDACTLPSCTGVCENTMPNDTPPGDGAALMAVTDRDTIRRWIAQGAKND